MADFNDRNTGRTSDESGTKRTADWAGHDEYWRDNYGERPYAHADRAYEYYQPGYKYGHESAFFYGGRAWDDEVANDLERGWDQARGDSNCTWAEVKDAVHDAYERSRSHAFAA
jgi:hypothetical protein